MLSLFILIFTTLVLGFSITSYSRFYINQKELKARQYAHKLGAKEQLFSKIYKIR